MTTERELIGSLPTEIQRMLAEQWEYEREKLRDKARENPARYKNVREFDKSASYRYYEAKDGRGREVRFCYSTHRNVAGYFLAWREVINKDGNGKRDGWIANKTKRKLIDRQRELARRMNDPR